jgi:hypothetical protein
MTYEVTVAGQDVTVTIDRGVAGRGITNLAQTGSGANINWVVTYSDGTTQTLGPVGYSVYSGTSPINITGSVISLNTVPVASGGTGATDAATARANLGLGSLSLQAANSVAITGGSVAAAVAATTLSASGAFSLTGDQVQVVEGGTGATTAAGARTNLGAAASGANSDITSMTGITGGVGTVDYIDFDVNAAFAGAVGRMGWNNATGTVQMGVTGGAVTAQVGQSLLALVVNAEATTIGKGQPVYLFAAQGNKASVKLANNTTDATSAKTFGLAAENIPANQSGFVMCQGVLDGLNTGAFAEGDTLYVGASPGTLTSTKPAAPNHLVYAGVVERANAGNGQIYVKVQNGYELDEIHDVQIVSPTTGQILIYNGTLWQNQSFFLAKTGYQVGGTITQATSKTTAVTLNAPSGQIVLNNTNLITQQVARFTLNNTSIEANDVLIVNRKSGGSDSSYQVWADSVSAGSCQICIQNISGFPLAESVTIGFAVIKATV